MTEEALFALVLAAPEADRAAFLDRECPDPALRARVDALLAADATRSPLPDLPTRDVPREEAGAVLAGKYRLSERIGEGGMGSVWVAHQTEPVKRRVAVKLIKAGMDSKAVLARFEAERQALAVMDHPNIAKVLDGGLAPDGRPFFVMELVKGVPITEFCDARKLTPKERLELFVPVCQAIQHAHQKGIIHRDIKPSNVLVALYDDRAVPKVIDFGIAKATGGTLTEHTIETAFGGVVGTPQYMSPEQASLNNLDVDTRSDLYSLGVLLYELLVGSPPFKRDELEKRGLLEILRVVREEEPPRPSNKLSTADALPTLSANRGTEPKKLTGLLRNELDWIVMKALEKDRARRYETANGFAADVNRYLAGEAVLAHPPTLGYRLKKFARRNKGRVTAASLVVMALIAGMVGTTWQMLRAEREATRARAEEAKVREEQARTQEARDAAELTLVHGFLRPIDRGEEIQRLVLDEIARQDDRIKLLFLREILNDGELALRVARQSEAVAQAAVGPSLKRRAATLELLSAKQREVQADPRTRLGACWLAIELGSDDLPALGESFDTLTKGMKYWPGVVGKLPSRIHKNHRTDLASALAAMISKIPPGSTLDEAVEGLTTLAPSVDATPINKGIDHLLTRDNLYYSIQNAFGYDYGSKFWTPLLINADTTTANRCFQKLVAMICQEEDTADCEYLEGPITTLSLRADSSVTINGFETLLDLLARDKLPKGKVAIGRLLTVLADRFTVSVAGSDQNPAGHNLRTLVALIDRSRHDPEYVRLKEAAMTLARLADPASANAVFDALLVKINLKEHKDLAIDVLRELVTRRPTLIGPDKRDRYAEVLFSVFQAKDFLCYQNAAKGIAAIASLTESARADGMLNRLANCLEADLQGTPENDVRFRIMPAYESIGGMLKPAVARKAFNAISSSFKTFKDHKDNWCTGRSSALESVSHSWNSKDAAFEMLRLIDTLPIENSYTPVEADLVLRTLTERIELPESNAVFERLIASFVKRRGAIYDITTKCAVLLADRADSATVSKGFETLLEYWISIDKQQLELQSSIFFDGALSKLAVRLDSTTAARCFRSLMTLPSEVKGVERLLAFLAPRLEPFEAVTLVREVFRTVAPGATDALFSSFIASAGYVDLVPWLDAKTACACLDALASWLGNNANMFHVERASALLRALALKMDAAYANRLFATLIANLGKNKSADGERMIEEDVLPALASRLTTADAERWFAVMAGRIAASTRAGLEAGVYIPVLSVLVDLAHRFDIQARRRCCDPAVPRILATLRSLPLLGYGIKKEDVVEILSLIDAVPHLVELLRDPQCTGSVRVGVLARLEELAFTKPDRAGVLVGLAAGTHGSLALSAQVIADNDHRQRNRHFRTVSDAAKWLAEHHPEIDLDRPYQDPPRPAK